MFLGFYTCVPLLYIQYLLHTQQAPPQSLLFPGEETQAFTPLSSVWVGSLKLPMTLTSEFDLEKAQSVGSSVEHSAGSW